MVEAEKPPERSLMEDIELINAFKAGDATAFDALVLRHKDRVFSLCYRFLGERR